MFLQFIIAIVIVRNIVFAAVTAANVVMPSEAAVMVIRRPRLFPRTTNTSLWLRFSDDSFRAYDLTNFVAVAAAQSPHHDKQWQAYLKNKIEQGWKTFLL